jgi:hypothetical protein
MRCNFLILAPISRRPFGEHVFDCNHLNYTTRDCRRSSKAIEIDPENVRAHTNRGFARGTKGDLAGAIDDATRAIDINPGFLAGYLVRAANYKARAITPAR